MTTQRNAHSHYYYCYCVRGRGCRCGCGCGCVRVVDVMQGEAVVGGQGGPACGARLVNGLVGGTWCGGGGGGWRSNGYSMLPWGRAERLLSSQSNLRTCMWPVVATVWGASAHGIVLHAQMVWVVHPLAMLPLLLWAATQRSRHEAQPTAASAVVAQPVTTASVAAAVVAATQVVKVGHGTAPKSPPAAARLCRTWRRQWLV